ncbi:MAG: FABP family protein [Acidimicrobiales bacterium]
MSDIPGPPIHEAIEPFRFMLGTWRGTGDGSYPTIEDFGYHEEVTFGHVGKPFLAYSQKTRHAETGLPLHAETGYWRPVGDGRFEVVLSHPTGILESLAGTFTPADGGGVFELGCDDVTLSETAVRVDRTARRFVIDGDELSYDFSMAAVGLDMTHHLRATLIRV